MHFKILVRNSLALSMLSHELILKHPETFWLLKHHKVNMKVNSELQFIPNKDALGLHCLDLDLISLLEINVLLRTACITQI